MLDELNKIGEISSIEDVFDFRFSIKTLLLIALLVGFCSLIILVMVFGGIENTTEYIFNLIEITKSHLKKNKNLSKIPMDKKLPKSHKFTKNINTKNNEEDSDED